jgi:hypothetical protein
VSVVKPIAIFDLDGCISDDRHRRHLLPHTFRSNPRPLDYTAYHALCGEDAPINHHALHERIDTHRIVFITARPEACRKATESWLRLAHTLSPREYDLLMRPAGDLRPSPGLKVDLFERAYGGVAAWQFVDVAYDDRQDVLFAYAAKGVTAKKLCVHTPKPLVRDVAQQAGLAKDPTEGAALASGHRRGSAADVLRAMADTFAERNAVYGDNYKRVAPVIKALFPDGVPQELVVSDRWHLFELLVVKLSRFAVSNLTHEDSIHDAAVYGAMIQRDLQESKQ